uniref:Uncharacterized protein n=1 Tax=Nitrosopumivirus cobalaminus TaxID=3158414 RepID=A0AAU7N4B3_9VIRU
MQESTITLTNLLSKSIVVYYRASWITCIR